MRLVVRRALEADGFEIADAASGPEALASIVLTRRMP